MSAAQAFELFLNQMAETKTVPLSFDYAEDEPNATTQQAMLEVLGRTDFSEALTAAESLNCLCQDIEIMPCLAIGSVLETAMYSLIWY